MRGFPFLAAVAAVSTASGAIVPLNSVRASSSYVLSSTIIHSRPAYDYYDYPFDWALASSLAGLTGAPPTATVHQHGTTTSPCTANTLSTAAEFTPKPVNASTGTPSQKAASSSSKMMQPTWTAVNSNSAAPNTLATSVKTSTPLPKTRTQSTRASVPTPSYVSFQGFIASWNVNQYV
jgi:hypothetical protein